MRPLFLGGRGQIFAMAGLVNAFVLDQAGDFQFLLQLDTRGYAAGGLGFFVVAAFVLFAVIHAGGQVVLFEHHRQGFAAVKRDHIAGRTHRTFGFIFDKRAFAEHRHLHAFFFRHHYRRDFLADKAGLAVADGQIGQHLVAFAQLC